jgi:hypothetical protein
MHYLETYHVTIGNNRKSAWDLAVPILNIRLREVSILYISIRYNLFARFTYIVNCLFEHSFITTEKKRALAAKYEFT